MNIPDNQSIQKVDSDLAVFFYGLLTFFLMLIVLRELALRFYHKHFYSTLKEVKYKKLLEDDFSQYIQRESDINISKARLFDVIKIEHENFKNDEYKDYKTPFSILHSPYGTTINTFLRYSIRKQSIVKRIAKISPLKDDEISEVLTLEQRYFRSRINIFRRIFIGF